LFLSELIQMPKFNFTPVQQVFADADASSLSFADRLLTLGIASRAEAKPHAMSWACLTHEGCKIVSGRQGDKLTNTSAERAMNRVLQICYPSSDKPVRTQKPVAKKTDAVAQLVTKYGKLTKAEQRRFLASI
jgi:hypothetical protein